MSGPTRIVLVGGGLAAAKTAQALRKRGYDGSLTLLAAEPHRPYERPPLSKGYLWGESPREEAFVHEAGWYADHDVELRTGTVAVALDRDRKEVRTASGERFGYDAVLLATGATPRRLPISGADADGVLFLRTIDDSEALRARLARRDPLVVVGGGWIGLEVAAAARRAGCEVTVVEAAGQPLQRVLGPRVAPAFAALHRDHGVRFELGAGVEALDVDGSGSVAGVRLADGRLLPAGTVLVAVGVRPADDLARAAGLEVGDGVLVGADLRTTDPAVVAAGDLAAVDHPVLGRRIRVEHWANALRQGPVAAAALLGQPASYERLPYVFSDQYDLSLEYVGAAQHPEQAQVVVRGSLEDQRYVAFWLEDGLVTAAMSVSLPGLVPALENLVRSGRPVEAARLADPEAPLEAVNA
jgi:3-phenylpropionate/trans-cinnamate dioxygenase ferredoxin reductase component